MLISSFNIFLIALITFVTYKYFALRENSGPHNGRYSQLVAGVSSIIDRVEGYDTNHCAELAAMSVALGRELGMNEEQLQAMNAAALLHDIGQMLLPRDIFRGSAKLNPEQQDLLKTHPLLGELHLKSQFDGVDEVPSLIRWHHERWDGMGYPDNLKGEEIPRAARVIALADAVSAMSQPRSYRSQVIKEKMAIAKELIRHSGLQFDPEVVATWLKINGISEIS